MTSINPNRYGRLLAKVLQRPIGSDSECERIISVIESMMNVNRSPEQDVLLQLLVGRVSDYEARTVPGLVCDVDRLGRVPVPNILS